jgi:REP element-mobilizing transposase RayT
MARGNRLEKIYADDDDRRFFLATLAEACGMTGWRVHGWVLMSNHYHLFIETPEANLVEGMKWLQNAYTRRFNVRHRKWGRLFGDRYKAVVVEGAAGDYYRTLLDYIHLNPVRAGIVAPARGQGVMDYAWSSLAGGYAQPPGRRAKWLAAAHGLAVLGCPDTAAGRRRFVERLDRRAVEEDAKRCGVPELAEEMDARCSHLRRGWLGHAGVWREAVGRAAGRSEDAQGSFLPERAGAAFARSRTGGGVVEDRHGSSRSVARGNQTAARKRCSEGRAGKAAVDEDDGVPGLDRRAARDGKRREREPATPARKDGQTALKIAPCAQFIHRSCHNMTPDPCVPVRGRTGRV